MGEAGAIIVAALFASLAWVYQKAWDRHERRVKQYEDILDEWPAFTVTGFNPDRID